MKLIDFPETRQTFCFDCGANALLSVLVYAGIEEREDRIALLAGTTEAGTSTAGILKVLQYYGLPFDAQQHMTLSTLRWAIDAGAPIILSLQAYRESNRPYRDLWADGHYVVAIGYDENRIYFEDPSAFNRTWLADEELLQRWHDSDDGQQILGWGCIVHVRGQFQPFRHIHME